MYVYIYVYAYIDIYICMHAGIYQHVRWGVLTAADVAASCLSCPKAFVMICFIMQLRHGQSDWMLCATGGLMQP